LPPGAYRHDGFYLRYPSLGPAYMSLFGNGPAGPASISGMGYEGSGAIGGTPAEGLVVAGAGSVAFGASTTMNGAVAGRQGKATAALLMLGVLVDWYPVPSEGWHAGGLLGFAMPSVTDAAGYSSQGLAWGASIHGGYDWWIGPQWSLGLAANASGSTTASMQDAHNNDTGYTFAAAAIGVQASLLHH
jgi:hypothetical protein